MDPLVRDEEGERALEDIILGDDRPPPSPSMYLNPSGDGDEQNRIDSSNEEEVNAGSRSGLSITTNSGEVYT